MKLNFLLLFLITHSLENCVFLKFLIFKFYCQASTRGKVKNQMMGRGSKENEIQVMVQIFFTVITII